MTDRSKGRRPGAWHGRRRTRRFVTFALAGVAWASLGGSAAADPAVPTHYRSTVTEVVDVDGDPVDLDIYVVGGDTYLVVEVAPGSEVQVPGYDGEPYIRIRPDGGVDVNQRSTARWLNDDRYGAAAVDVPAIADPSAPPEWRRVADDGQFAWHDHRIHYMSPGLPSQVDPSVAEVQDIWEWELPMVVDDEPVTIRGSLVWVPGSSPWTPIGMLVVAVGAGVLLLRWVGSDRGPDVLLVVAALAGLALALSNHLNLPDGADRIPALWVLPIVTVAAAAAGRLRAVRDRGVAAPILRLLAVVPAVVPAVMLFGSLWRPIVPGELSTEITRVVIVVILTSCVLALALLAREIWQVTSLEDADDISSDA